MGYRYDISERKMMETKKVIDHVSSSHNDVRISFTTANWGDIVITMQAYTELGKPSVGDTLYFTVGSKQ